MKIGKHWNEAKGVTNPSTYTWLSTVTTMQSSYVQNLPNKAILDEYHITLCTN